MGNGVVIGMGWGEAGPNPSIAPPRPSHVPSKSIYKKIAFFQNLHICINVRFLKLININRKNCYGVGAIQV